MEIYIAYKDYIWMMEFVEEMLERVSPRSARKYRCNDRRPEDQLRTSVPTGTMTDAIREKTGFDITGKSEEELCKACDELHVETDETMGKGKLIDAIFGQYCEEDLIQPTFVTDYPIEMSPLLQTAPQQPRADRTVRVVRQRQGALQRLLRAERPDRSDGAFSGTAAPERKGRRRSHVHRSGFCPRTGIRHADLLRYGNGHRPPHDVQDRTVDRAGCPVLPQMRPEKATQKDSVERFGEAGVPAEWVPVLNKMGFLTVDAIKKLSPGKLFNDLCGYNKKNKLGLKNPTMDEVKQWCLE